MIYQTQILNFDLYSGEAAHFFWVLQEFSMLKKLTSAILKEAIPQNPFLLSPIPSMRLQYPETTVVNVTEWT